jgi:hypothetical protein
MLWVVLIIVVFIIVKFAIAASKQSVAVARQGGMCFKYKTLISYILEQEPRAKLKESAASVEIGYCGPSGCTSFFIMQTFGTVTIQWRVDNMYFGKHQIEWKFDENTDQHKMIDKIEYDLAEYQSNIMNKYK